MQKVISKNRPSFLWDYDLDEGEVRRILKLGGVPPEKRWLMERILTQARFEEVLKYLNLYEIRKSFASLQLPNKIKQRWAYALKRWFPHE